ncbi:uncharacterized protein [Watersipora subatra]|uniref:uncharacterized protein n=1 Tax=Watersipora subatra TaxID=2589382 RepID=UPI00355B132A
MNASARGVELQGSAERGQGTYEPPRRGSLEHPYKALEIEKALIVDLKASREAQSKQKRATGNSAPSTTTALPERLKNEEGYDCYVGPDRPKIHLDQAHQETLKQAHTNAKDVKLQGSAEKGQGTYEPPRRGSLEHPYKALVIEETLIVDLEKSREAQSKQKRAAERQLYDNNSQKLVDENHNLNTGNSAGNCTGNSAPSMTTDLPERLENEEGYVGPDKPKIHLDQAHQETLKQAHTNAKDVELRGSAERGQGIYEPPRRGSLEHPYKALEMEKTLFVGSHLYDYFGPDDPSRERANTDANSYIEVLPT